MGVYATLRALRRTQWPRIYGAIGSVLILGIGIPLAANIVRGIGQPPWGSTPGLWLSWEIPLFLFLFAVLLLAYCTVRVAFGRQARVSVPAALILASVAGTAAIGALWSTTSRQRARLAEEDVARLAEVDDYALMLTRRLAASLSDSQRPMTRSALLKLYATSDLRSAELPATLSAWDPSGARLAEFAITAARPDSEFVMRTVREVLATGEPDTRSILGPTGAQILSAIPHSDGGDPPYAVALTDASLAIPASFDRLRWHRTGNELHADRLVGTSNGVMRAHVEIDLRSRWARAERGLLLLLLNILLAGALWLIGAAAEHGFVRWVRARAARWVYTYRARLILALFTFFIVPAIAFAIWSYQRLQSDDEQTREVLVRETLDAVGSGNEYDRLP